VNGFHRQTLLRVAISLSILMVPLRVTPHRGPSQLQSTPTNTPAYEYEVVSIKSSKPANGGRMRIGITNTPDGLTAENSTVQSLVNEAYGTQDFQIIGSPSWLNSEMYDVDAKMDRSVADALQKLAPAERRLARQRMLQAVLADRMKLTIHRDSKEVAVYNLVIANNSTKLRQANPDDTYANGFKTADGRTGRGMMNIEDGVGEKTMTSQGITITSFVETLSGLTGRAVVDKTGLNGKYDFTLKWKPDDSRADTNGPSLFTAIREQLGLKLEPGKGPVEIIVIDHIERPSGN
jgi:uncharacterized protein (TIGR03435 family)